MKTIKISQAANAALLCMAIVALTACGAKRSSVSSGGVLAAKAQATLLADVVDKGLKYENISGKMDMELLAANAKSGFKTDAYVKVYAIASSSCPSARSSE